MTVRGALWHRPYTRSRTLDAISVSGGVLELAQVGRFKRVRMFNAVKRELGYKVLDIYSPREVTQHEEG